MKTMRNTAADRPIVLHPPAAFGASARVGERPPFISVLVPVRNEERFIGDTLAQLLGQHYDADRFEVLVADGGSTDATCSIVAAWQRDYPNLHLLDNPAGWSSAGRNVALQAAQGDLIVLIDGHCELNNLDYLADVADAFTRSGADCLGRPQPLDVSGASPLQQAIALARASRLGHHPSSHIYSSAEGFVPPQSVAVAYRRSVFRTVGLFDEAFDACEDVELNHRIARAGLRCYFTPRIKVHYFPRGTLGGLFQQMVRYGRGRVRLLRKHRDTFTVPGFVPAVFLAGLVTGPLLGCLSTALAWTYLGVLAVYVLTLLLTSLVLSVCQRQPRLLPLLPFVFLCIHLGAGTGIWREVFASLSPRRSHLMASRRPVPTTSPASSYQRRAA
jgi:succinoglycan biosynthesis protein ExoA